MAVTFGNITTFTDNDVASSPINYSFNHDHDGNGGLLLLIICIENVTNSDNFDVLSTYNSVNMPSEHESQQGMVDDVPRCEAFYLANPASGINLVDIDITISDNGGGTANDAIAAIAISLNDDNGIGAVASNFSDASLNNITAVINVQEIGSRIVGLGAGQGNDLINTPGSGYTRVVTPDIDTGGGSSTQDMIVTVQERTSVATGNLDFNISWSTSPQPFEDCGILCVELLAAAAGTNVAVGLSSETDSAQSVNAQRIVPVGLSAETDTAQTVTPVTSTNVAVGLASETDTAQAITIRREVQVGLSSETDTAQQLTAQRLQPVGQSSEADSALSVAVSRSLAIGLPSETDSAQSIAISRIFQVGLSSETDSAQTISPVGQGQVAVGLSTETDTAQPIVPIHQVEVGQAQEVDTAGSTLPARVVPIGLSTETDNALPISTRQTLQLSLASETDSAFPILIQGGVAVVVGRDASGGSGAASSSRAMAEAREFIRRRRQEEEDIILALAMGE